MGRARSRLASAFFQRDVEQRAGVAGRGRAARHWRTSPDEGLRPSDAARVLRPICCE